MVPTGRIASHWLPILAVGLIATSGFGFALAADQVQHAPESQQPPKGEGQNSPKLRSAPVSPPGNPVAKPRAESHSDDTGKKAEGVEPGSWPDWVIVAFTFVLTIVGIQQYLLDKRIASDTVESINLAKKSAEAAELAARATMVSVESYKRAERAWIGPMGMTVGFSSGWLDGNPVREGFVFTIQLMNTGNTPAIYVQSRITHAVRDIGDEEVPVFEVAHDFNGSMSTSAMKGFAFSPPIRMLNDVETNQFRERRVKVYAYCRVHYENSLAPGQPCVTEICLMGKYNGEVTDPASGMRHPNINWSPIGEQNRAT
jgi:hypothetical protein